MSLADWIILGILGILIGSACAALYRQKKNKKGGCGGDCSSCGGCH